MGTPSSSVDFFLKLESFFSVFLSNQPNQPTVKMSSKAQGKEAASNTMEAIRKKMQQMKKEKEESVDRAEQAEERMKELQGNLKERDDEINSLNKKIQQVENDLDTTTENLSTANTNLESANKQVQESEGEVSALQRRCQLVEEDLERSEERLGIASEKLEEASKAADESESCESPRSLSPDLSKYPLLQLVYQASMNLSELESTLDQTEFRIEESENNIQEQEGELHCLGQKMKELTVLEAEGRESEFCYEEQMNDLMARVHDADRRASEYEEKKLALVLHCINLEEQLEEWKGRFEEIATELESTFMELETLQDP